MYKGSEQCTPIRSYKKMKFILQSTYNMTARISPARVMEGTEGRCYVDHTYTQGWSVDFGGAVHFDRTHEISPCHEHHEVRSKRTTPKLLGVTIHL